MNSSKRRIAALVWCGVLAIAWIAYAPALGGVFLLDDASNLAGLAAIEDGRSALNFVLSGHAGPLGRPLALATFVPQAAAWEHGAEPFLAVNILIHLGNACLLLWVLYRLTAARCDRAGDPLLVACTAAGLWLLMPLLASSSLMVIQRMTTLSACFVLLGLAGYLSARQLIERQPGRALTGMTASLVLGTVLAVLTKENGALLPTFALVIEATLLGRPQSVRSSRWRTWQVLFLIVPTVLILAYLAWRVPYAQEIVLKREFTAWERLLTESRILWEYLFNAFIARPGQFGPFHDGYPVARTIMNPVTLAASAAWLLVLVLAAVWRRRYPLFAFAALWFLGGHLLESTVIPLDLYYEHRNYVPIVGPLYAVCALLARVPSPRKILAYAGTAAYALVSAFMVFSQASLWGNPSVAFQYWQERFPDSIYAATAAMAHVQATQGPEATIRAIRQYVSEHPEAGYLRIYELKLSCIANPAEDRRAAVSELDRLLEHADFSYTALNSLSQLAQEMHRTQCNGIGRDDVRHWAHLLRSNPRYRQDTLYQQLHHQFMALLAQHEGDSDVAIQHLRKAIEYKPSTDLNKMLVMTYASEQQFDAARAYIAKARQEAPLLPMKRFVWLNRLDTLLRYVDEAEKQRVLGSGSS